LAWLLQLSVAVIVALALTNSYSSATTLLKVRLVTLNDRSLNENTNYSASLLLLEVLPVCFTKTLGIFVSFLKFYLFFILCSTDDFVLEQYGTEIITESIPSAISLAGHPHSVHAKMYGAFWRSHCND
jgi:hypothetical protein